MMNVEVTDRQIVDYLLGVAEAADAERIEELSFTDDDFAVRINLMERELVDAYAAGVMEAGRRGPFETHYLASPLRRERLKFAEAFQTLALEPGVAVSAEGTSGTSYRDPRNPWWAALFGWNPVAQLSVAALVMIAAATGWWLFTSPDREIATSPPDVNPGVANAHPTPSQGPDATPGAEEGPGREHASQQPADKRGEQADTARGEARRGAPDPLTVRNKRVFSLILGPPVRSGGLRTLTLPPDAERVAVRLELESGEFASYRVSLRQQASDAVVWQSKSLKPTSSKNRPSLSIIIPAGLLKSQIFQFTVSGTTRTGSTEIIGDYPFKVVR